MKKTVTWGIAILASGVFVGLVYAVLRMAGVAEPAATTLHGATARRLWATGSVALALGGVVVGILAWARPRGRCASIPACSGVVVAGAIAAINGGLVLALATGGPGSGNGVVGGAVALVLGLAAAGLGGRALARPASREPNLHLTRRSKQ